MGIKKRKAPMAAEMRNQIALELHMAVEAMILAPSEEAAWQIGSFLLTLATAINASGRGYVLDRGDSDAIALQEALDALRLVEKRREMTGLYHVNWDEAAVLRQASGGLDNALARVPYAVFQESCAQVRIMGPGMGRSFALAA